MEQSLLQMNKLLLLSSKKSQLEERAYLHYQTQTMKKGITKRKMIGNLENARKVKKTKEPHTKGKLKTALVRFLKDSQLLCGAETQALLNQLDNYLTQG